jgi:hypothetical protein
MQQDNDATQGNEHEGLRCDPLEHCTQHD